MNAEAQTRVSSGTHRAYIGLAGYILYSKHIVFYILNYQIIPFQSHPENIIYIDSIYFVQVSMSIWVLYYFTTYKTTAVGKTPCDQPTYKMRDVKHQQAPKTIINNKYTDMYIQIYM